MTLFDVPRRFAGINLNKPQGDGLMGRLSEKLSNVHDKCNLSSISSGNHMALAFITWLSSPCM